MNVRTSIFAISILLPAAHLMGQIVSSSGITISGASTNGSNQSVTMELVSKPGGVVLDFGTITVFPGQTAATTATNLTTAINNVPNAAGITVTNADPGEIDVTATQNVECRFCAGNGPCVAGDVVPPAKMDVRTSIASRLRNPVLASLPGIPACTSDSGRSYYSQFVVGDARASLPNDCYAPNGAAAFAYQFFDRRIQGTR